jgi:hypothetical protein
MPYDKRMSTREHIARELERLPEQDLDRLLSFLRSIKEAHSENAVPTLAAESAIAKDWLTPEEDSAWASLQELRYSFRHETEAYRAAKGPAVAGLDIRAEDQVGRLDN